MSVLDVRLASIERHLEQAQDPRHWLSLRSPTTQVSQNLWEFAFEAIQDDAGELETRIEELREELAGGRTSEADAWTEYQSIRARTEAVLRECLDLLGGLVLRDASTDDSICQLADELIFECAQPSFKVVATLPALADYSGGPLTSTLRRVASVRFPDWSRWTVPLVAHEYAAVMTEVEDVLREFVTSCSTAWVLAHPQDTPEAVEELRVQAASHARVLVADAFATFAMGPAYACPALLLRLDPAVGGHRHRPSDATRAGVVLGVLEAMDVIAMGAYTSIRTNLQGQWDSMRALSSPATAEDDMAGVVPAQHVADYLHRRFKYKRTGYSTTGWAEAGMWSTQWKQSLSTNRRLAVPGNLRDDHSLRDALNALWDTRLWVNAEVKAPDQNDLWVEEVEGVGRQLCDQLVARRRANAIKAARVPKVTRTGSGG